MVCVCSVCVRVCVRVCVLVCECVCCVCVCECVCVRGECAWCVPLQYLRQFDGEFLHRLSPAV